MFFPASLEIVPLLLISTENISTYQSVPRDGLSL